MVGSLAKTAHLDLPLGGEAGHSLLGELILGPSQRVYVPGLRARRSELAAAGSLFFVQTNLKPHLFSSEQGAVADPSKHGSASSDSP